MDDTTENEAARHHATAAAYQLATLVERAHEQMRRTERETLAAMNPMMRAAWKEELKTLAARITALAERL